MEKVHDIDSMVAGIMAFVEASKKQRARDGEPKDIADIYINAGYDLAIEMAEACAVAIASQKGVTHD